MSTKENTAPPNETSGAPDPGWPDLQALAPASPSASQNLTVYFHSLRRHWVLAAGLGLLFAAALGPLVWFVLWAAEYKASAYLRVAAKRKSMVSGFESPASNQLSVTTFDIYKNTQLQYIQRPLVLAAALRKAEVAKYKLDEREDDPIVWLQQELSMGFPGDAELMEISLTCYDPEEAATLVNSVVDAYLTEVVEVEQKEQRDRLASLVTIFSQKHAAVEKKRSDLKAFAQSMGASDEENLTLKQRVQMEELAALRRQLMQLQHEQRLGRGELESQKALLSILETTEIPAFELERLTQQDPLSRDLAMGLAGRKLALTDARARTRPGSGSRYTVEIERSLAQAQAELDAHKDSLREGIREMKRSEIDAEIQKIQAKLEVLGKQEEGLAAEVAAKSQEVKNLSGSPVEIEMRRAEIEYLDRNLTSIGQERDQLEVEIRSAPRITLFQAAAPPETQANLPVRVAVTVLMMGIAFCFPAVGIVLWDSSSRRVNTSEQVSKDLGLTVIGSVPLIPARILQRLDSPSKQGQTWQSRLTESVDAVAAWLLRQAEREQERVVLITSAVSGEGKTTLATQLAMSLARSGHSTVLVDFDLRRPAFDRVFGLPGVPGISEVLRRQADLSQSVHQTGTENLSVVTAGRWDRHALAALANGAAEPIFEELRAEYEFVIVDASPILPVADARFVSQYVDAVILSVFRDISRTPKVQQTCDILKAFGVSTVEAVVTGSSEKLGPKDLGYQAQQPEPV